MEDILIRRAGEQDLSAVVHLEIVCFSDPWSREGLRAALAQEHGLWYCAYRGEKLVGMLGAQGIAPEGEILSVAVHPEYRRRGIARALIARYLKDARDMDVVFLEVRRSNTAAQALYASFGFAVCGERKNYYERPVEDAVLMRRQRPETEPC